jgi:hypothetical protein
MLLIMWNLRNVLERKYFFLFCWIYFLDIDQTGRSFQVKYTENIRAIHENRDSFRYVQNILNIGHSYGPIQDTMEIVATAKK